MELTNSGIAVSFNNLFAWVTFGLAAGAMAHYFKARTNNNEIVSSMLLGALGAVSGGAFATFIYGMGMRGLDLTSLAISIIASLTFLTVYSLSANSSNASR